MKLMFQSYTVAGLIYPLFPNINVGLFNNRNSRTDISNITAPKKMVTSVWWTGSPSMALVQCT